MLLCLLDVRAPPHYNYQPPASLLKPGITFEDGSSYRLVNGIVDCHLFGATSPILDGSRATDRKFDLLYLPWT